MRAASNLVKPQAKKRKAKRPHETICEEKRKAKRTGSKEAKQTETTKTVSRKKKKKKNRHPRAHSDQPFFSTKMTKNNEIHSYTQKSKVSQELIQKHVNKRDETTAVPEVSNGEEPCAWTCRDAADAQTHAQLDNEMKTKGLLFSFL